MNGVFPNRYPDLYEFAPVGYVGLDACGIIRALNFTGAQLLGSQRDHALGTLFLDHVAKQDRVKFLRHLQECQEHGAGLTELTLITAAGQGRPVVLDSRATGSDDPADPEYRIRYWVSVIDVSERKRAEEALRKAHAELAERAAELEAANRALQEADRRKDEFLAMLGHELRNPLAPIRNTAQVLRRLDLPASRATWASDLIERQVAHLSRLVDDLLDVSRITRGTVQLHRRSVELAGLLAHAIETLRPLLDAHEHHLETTLLAEPIVLDADPDRVIQIFENLLTNAVKYTPKGGKIKLAIEQTASAVIISVIDNGIGIAPDLLPRIFDLFAQANQGLDRRQGGLGIGLTLVRRLVELHGGHIEAVSPGLGQGSTFRVRLPKRCPGVTTSPDPERVGGSIE
jgi:signal transduction histidine kinase